MASTSAARAESEPRPLTGYTVLTAVDENYLNIFALWLRWFESSGYLSYLKVITYDAKSTHFVERRGLACIRMAERINDPRQIYVSRLDVIQDLIDRGTHVIHTDADAFWLRPDLSTLTKPSLDLHISTGHGIPREAMDEWGFSLCCGFFILHATKQSKTFLRSWLQRTRDMNHDQRALNDLLLERKVDWNGSESTGKIGYCPSFDMHVEAISSAVISRDTPIGVQIYHPYLPGRYEQVKMLQLATKLEPSRRKALLQQARIVLDVRGWQRMLGHLARKVRFRATHGRVAA
jgi:hypothetical protein